MCGFNGIVSIRNINGISERISRMNKAIAHRGPDADCKKIISEKIALGHRRLSIIDLDERSSQPMANSNGSLTIVFNGEIFNYKELRNQLKEHYNFKTESDTEVLLAGFQINGIDWLLENINGMFAFAIYNNIDDTVYLVKDRFGIKPLYYTIVDDTLIFASEIKSILESGLIDAKLNRHAIDDYLGYRFVREPYTFFEDIFQLKSATYLKFHISKLVQEKKYWSLPKLNFDVNFNESEIIHETKYEIEQAILRWQIADVKLGAYLSGGVDSSLTTAILANNTNSGLDTYTIGFSEDGFNEFKYARKVAERYNTKHREFLLTENDYMDEWLRLIEFKDAPLSVPNEIPLSIMTTKLSSDITVVISGEGADELFGGYGRIYRSAFDYDNHNHDSTSFYNYFINEYEYVSREIRDKYLSYIDARRDILDDSQRNEFEFHSNEESIFRFFHNTHIKGLLQRVDMTTMQASVEARPPFLDHKLVEYVYRHVPYDLKLKWKDITSKESAKTKIADLYSEKLDTPKYILKKIAEFYLPNDIIYRRKMGFPVPLTNWFSGLTSLAEVELKNTNWLNEGVVKDLINEIKNTNSQRAGQILWMFLNVEIFVKKYFNKNWKW